MMQKSSDMKFMIEKKIKGRLGRAGKISTENGVIETPAFVAVATKATVKALTPAEVKAVGVQVVLGNTYHLYLEPGHEAIQAAGGLAGFMGWGGPTMTDSGGFQVFSLGTAFGRRQSKISSNSIYSSNIPQNIGIEKIGEENETKEMMNKLVKIDEEGVDFISHKDGSKHRFTPERSIEIQHAIGADIIFAFDECTAPEASYEYQKEAMERTHRWATRSLVAHRLPTTHYQLPTEKQMLFGIVQGGRFEDLRKESAQTIGGMDFDGFGIGGSFEKKDIDTAVRWVNEVLPSDKPRHLLGIGEPADLFGAIENGSDLFDCVAPTRNGRTGTLYTKEGKINIRNAKFFRDFFPVEKDCGCYTCQNFTKAYLCHLFRSEEMLAATLASIHNLQFIVGLVKQIRQAVIGAKFSELREEFLRRYRSS